MVFISDGRVFGDAVESALLYHNLPLHLTTLIQFGLVFVSTETRT